MKLLKTFTKYATGSLFALLAGLISTPILTRLISTEEMGKYSMFITIGSLFSYILFLGLDQAYVRFYNDEAACNRKTLLNKCLCVSLAATAIISLLILVFFAAFSKIIIGKESLVLTLVFVLYLFGLIVDRFWLLKIRMEQKAGVYSILNVIRKLSFLLLSIIFYYFAWSDSYWSLIIAVTLAEIVLIFGCKFSDREKCSNEECEMNTSMKDILVYGFPFIFSSAITLVFQSTDKLMLNALTNYNQIGIYAGAQNIVNLITQVQLVFTTFWTPVAYEHFSNSPSDKDFFIKINKIISYCMLIAAIILLCFKDVIVLFLGKNYREAVYVFPFLAFMPIMYTVSETTVMGINFTKKTQYHVWISFICAIINAIGNYYLIKMFGAKGAAISTGLTYIVFFLLRTYLANKCYPIKYEMKRFMISALAVYLLAIYSSFIDVNGIFVFASILVSCFISVLYRDIIVAAKRYIRIQINMKKEKK